MKIEYIEGDLLRAEEYCILHGCNSMGVQGSGVALAIKNHFPPAFTEYRKTYIDQGNVLHLGQVIWADCGSKMIANCITQQFYGYDGKRYVSYDALADCFAKINADMVAVNTATGGTMGTRVGMPLIGADRGGGKWEVIAEIIETSFTDIQPVVYILP